MKKILPIFILMILFLPFAASANVFGYTQCNASTLSQYPNTQKLCLAVEDIGDILFVAGMVLAVIFIIIGGIKYVTAGDDEEKVKSSKKMIINSLIGVAIIIAAFFLIQMVSEFIVNRLTGG